MSLQPLFIPEQFVDGFVNRFQRRLRAKIPNRDDRERLKTSRKLILKLAKETGWGYCRILGELKKLGIESVTRNTVKNITSETVLTSPETRPWYLG